MRLTSSDLIAQSSYDFRESTKMIRWTRNSEIIRLLAYFRIQIKLASLIRHSSAKTINALTITTLKLWFDL